MGKRLVFKINTDYAPHEFLELFFSKKCVGTSQKLRTGQHIFKIMTLRNDINSRLITVPYIWEEVEGKKFDSFDDIKKFFSKNNKKYVEYFTNVLNVTSEWYAKQEKK